MVNGAEKVAVGVIDIEQPLRQGNQYAHYRDMIEQSMQELPSRPNSHITSDGLPLRVIVI